MSAPEVTADARQSAKENPPNQGLRILSFDGGGRGPGSYSQMLMLKEFVKRLEWDNQHDEDADSDEEVDIDENKLCPADYFDMMGGVGFGAFCALILGRLRLSFKQAIDELITLAHTIPPNTPTETLNPDDNLGALKKALEDMLRRNKFPVNLSLKGDVHPGRKCKVVIFTQATSTPGNCTPFRTYSTRTGQGPECTFVEAACAVLSELQIYPSIAIGLERQETLYAGIPYGFNNPTRKVLNEAFASSRGKKDLSLILSLGGGKPFKSSINVYAPIPGTNVALLTEMVMDSERVDHELALQLSGVDLYLRLNVERGLEDLQSSDWLDLGRIGAHTQSYVGNGSISARIDQTLGSLRANDHLTFAQLNGAACHAVSRVPIEQKLNGLEREFKSMWDIVMQGVEKITIIDAIGNRIPIPLNFCATYEMLQDTVKVYFKHQKAPGSSFVNRGEYKLVYGENKRMVKAGEWTYTRAPNLTLEVSMVVRKRGQYEVRCPKCNVEFKGIGLNGWAICSNRACKMQYQYQAKEWKYLPASTRKESGYQFHLEESSKSSTSQVERNESVERFRLVSVVHQNEYEFDAFFPDFDRDRNALNQRMNVSEDELGD